MVITNVVLIHACRNCGYDEREGEHGLIQNITNELANVVCRVPIKAKPVSWVSMRGSSVRDIISETHYRCKDDPPGVWRPKPVLPDIGPDVPGGGAV